MLAAQAQCPRHQLRVAPDGLGVAGGPGVADVERLRQAEHRRQLGVVASAVGRVAGEDGAHLRAVDHAAVAPQRLGGVERLVRRAQQRVHRRAVDGVAGYAEAHGQAHGLGGEQAPQPAAQPLGQDVGLVLVGLRQHQRELLAAHAGRGVDAPLVVVQERGDALQGLVPRVVPELVVDQLEEVAVPHQEAERPVAAAGALELGLGDVMEAAAVEQARERIGAGGVREPVDQPADAVAQRDDEHSRHRQGAGDQDEVVDVAVGQADRGVAVVQAQQQDGRAVVDHREGAEEPGPGPGQEVEGVDPDPQVEEHVGAGALIAVVQGGRDERRPGERRDRHQPAGRALAQGQQQERRHQARRLERDQPDDVEAGGMGEQHPDEAQDAGAGEHARLRAAQHGRGERPDGPGVLVQGGSRAIRGVADIGVSQGAEHQDGYRRAGAAFEASRATTLRKPPEKCPLAA